MPEFSSAEMTFHLSHLIYQSKLRQCNVKYAMSTGLYIENTPHTHPIGAIAHDGPDDEPVMGWQHIRQANRMSTRFFLTPLPESKFIQISGSDRVTFLQGLVSQDVMSLEKQDQAGIWAAFLTPQGKYLFDFLITNDTASDSLLLEIQAAKAEEAFKKLRLYKLRSQIDLSLREDLTSYALFAEEAAELLPEADISLLKGLHLYKDPRQRDTPPYIGYHLIAEKSLSPAEICEKLSPTLPNIEIASDITYQARRISCAIPDSLLDLESGKTTLLEAGFDALNGISWDKGCYMGQELTARTKYRGLVKKCLCPMRFKISDIVPENISAATYQAINGSYAIYQETQKVGQLRSFIYDPETREVLGLVSLSRTALSAVQTGEKTLEVEGIASTDLTLLPPAWLKQAISK